jgi:hypothetical protein
LKLWLCSKAANDTTAAQPDIIAIGSQESEFKPIASAEARWLELLKQTVGEDYDLSKWLHNDNALLVSFIGTVDYVSVRSCIRNAVFIR